MSTPSSSSSSSPATALKKTIAPEMQIPLLEVTNTNGLGIKNPPPRSHRRSFIAKSGLVSHKSRAIQTQSRLVDAVILRIDLIAALIAALGTIMGMAVVHFQYDPPSGKHVNSILLEIMRLMVSISTLTLVLVEMFEYSIILKRRKSLMGGSYWHNFWASSSKYKLPAELLILSIHPFPYCPPEIGEWLGTLMFLRIYLIVPLLRDFSPVFREREQLKRTHKDVPFEFTIAFTLRSLFWQHSMIICAVCFAYCIVVLGFCVMVFERKVQPELFGTLFNAIWFGIVTSATIGYGDIYPYTVGGRLIAAIQGVGGVVLVSVFTAALTSRIVPNFQEQVAMRHSKRSKILAKMQKIAGLMIWHFYTYHKHRKGLPANSPLLRYTYFAMKAKLKDLRKKLKRHQDALAISNSELRDTALDFKINRLRDLINTNRRDVMTLTSQVLQMRGELSVLTNSIVRQRPPPPPPPPPPQSDPPRTRSFSAVLLPPPEAPPAQPAKPNQTTPPPATEQ